MGTFTSTKQNLKKINIWANTAIRLGPFKYAGWSSFGPLYLLYIARPPPHQRRGPAPAASPHLRRAAAATDARSPR